MAGKMCRLAESSFGLEVAGTIYFFVFWCCFPSPFSLPLQILLLRYSSFLSPLSLSLSLSLLLSLTQEQCKTKSNVVVGTKKTAAGKRKITPFIFPGARLRLRHRPQTLQQIGPQRRRRRVPRVRRGAAVGRLVR